MLIMYNNGIHCDIRIHVYNVFWLYPIFCFEAASPYVAPAFLKLTMQTKVASNPSEIHLILPPKY